MRTLVGILFFALFLSASSGCSWLSSGTPLANATNGTLDCVKVGATDAAVAAGPVLLNDLIKWATGGSFAWSDVLAAFGGIETIIKDGISVATCSYYAIAAAFEATTSSAIKPASVSLYGRVLSVDDAAKVARLARTMIALRGLKTKTQFQLRAALVTP